MSRQVRVGVVGTSWWTDVDPRDMISTLTPGSFAKRSIGDRLFIDAILEGRPASPSFYDGWKAQQVIDAAIESHRSGAWVMVEFAESKGE